LSACIAKGVLVEEKKAPLPKNEKGASFKIRKSD
jgi:hypothetical protein